MLPKSQATLAQAKHFTNTPKKDNMQNINGSQASPEIPINENFALLSCFQVYGMSAPTTTGLTWGYFGGRWGGFPITDSTLALTASNANYLVVAKATGVLSTTTANTHWLDTTNYVRVYKVTTDGVSPTAIEDHRVGTYGVFG